MLQSTRGLVFHVSRYADSSGIVKIYTEEYGLQSFIVKSLFSRRARMRPGMFGHLALLDMVADYKPGRTLHYLREISLNKSFHGISDNIGKSTILLFINEVLYKSIREEEVNKELFNFIEYTLVTLNDTTLPIHSFHLLFLIHLSEHLGFGPALSLTGDEGYFDMLTGVSSETLPDHTYYINGQALVLLRLLIQRDYPQLEGFNYAKTVRFELLDKYLDFFRIHLPDMSELKSVKVLHEILSDV